MGILDFGLWGFWILDFGPLCSKSLCEAKFGDFGILDFGGFGDFGFWGFWILDFEVGGMKKFGCKIRSKFWILHKSKKTVHASPGRRIYFYVQDRFVVKGFFHDMHCFFFRILFHSIDWWNTIH